MAQLSRGQMQRVALVRAALLQPKLLLADEPTANLDDDATQQVLAFLTRLSADGTAILMASHDPRVAPWANAAIAMQHASNHVD
jgi:putative ABC transport system ATP-binding protein